MATNKTRNTPVRPTLLTERQTELAKQQLDAAKLAQKVQMKSDNFAAQVGFEVEMEAVEKQKLCKFFKEELTGPKQLISDQACRLDIFSATKG